MAHNKTVGKWSPEKLAQCLGWFSIGLGVAEVLAPRQMSRWIGAKKEHSVLLRMLGLREIASGVGILSQHRPAGWVWSRVGGDAMNLALLTASMTPDNPQRCRAAVATAAVVGISALDFLCGQELSRNTSKPSGDGATHLETSVTIDRSPEELYAFWRDFQNLPKFMNHLISVQVQSPTQSHWVAKGPAGTDVEWDAEIVTDLPNEVIAWQSLEGADVANAGSVRFERAPGDRGTIVRVKMQYRPMGGSMGSAVAKMLGKAPEKQIKVDLYRLKQVMETGEIARTEGQSAGRSRSTSRKFDDLVRR